jgi:L-iditol 2-dehydrogenase
MWAQTLTGPGSFSLVEVPDAGFDSDNIDQVLIEVLAGGICGSDLPLFRGITPLNRASLVGAPGYPLHEVVGRVARSHSGRQTPGAYVVGWAPRLNGLCEKLVVSATDVLEYDAAVPPTTAVLLQPLACVLAAVAQVRDRIPLSAAVIGQGPIGILFSHVLKSLGVRRVIGVDPVDRADVARAFGVDEVVTDCARIWAAGVADEDRPELVVEAVGHQTDTLEDAVDALADGGRFLYFGIPDQAVYPFPIHRFQRKNATFWSGTTRDKRAALVAASTYLTKHPQLCEIYVTNVFAVSNAQQAFELASIPAMGRLKVVLDYS